MIFAPGQPGVRKTFGGTMGRRLACSLVFVAACTGNKDELAFTEDINIDKADEGNDPDSFGTEMCVTPEGTIYVLWMDNRDHPDEDRFDIWMNVSEDLGKTWFPTA